MVRRHMGQEAFGRGGSHETPHDWATPQDLFEAIQKRYGKFDVDVCANSYNTKVPDNYYSPEDDGLAQNWGRRLCWLNPPYGRNTGKWMKKAADEAENGALVIGLVFVRSDTKWWHETVPRASNLILLKGRVAFERGEQKAPAPMPSCLIEFNSGGGPPALRHWDWR